MNSLNIHEMDNWIYVFIWIGKLKDVQDVHDQAKALHY